MISARFPPSVRIKRRADFLRVQNGGRRRHLRFFLVFVQSRECQGGEEDLPPTRLGITVTRKVGNAVERNHIKRMVRDVFRQEQCDLPAGLDMVWVAKRQAAGVAHEQVRADFLQLQRALPRPGVDSSVVVLDAGSGTLSPGPAATSGSGMGGRK